MNNLPSLFVGIFFTLAFSWTGIVFFNQITIGQLEPTAMQEGDRAFPLIEDGLAKRGKLVYQDLGCVYCHSQQVRRQGFGADYERGWGNRQTVARDYVGQDRVLLGTMRTGPDLKNVGLRYNAEWQHQHLYNPQTTSPGSIMPPYPFLYEVREIVGEPSVNAIKLPADFAPPEGYEVVPTPRAEALVAYLLSLKVDYNLPESQSLE